MGCLANDAPEKKGGRVLHIIEQLVTSIWFTFFFFSSVRSTAAGIPGVGSAGFGMPAVRSASMVGVRPAVECANIIQYESFIFLQVLVGTLHIHSYIHTWAVLCGRQISGFLVMKSNPVPA